MNIKCGAIACFMSIIGHTYAFTIALPEDTISLDTSNTQLFEEVKKPYIQLGTMKFEIADMPTNTDIKSYTAYKINTDELSKILKNKGYGDSDDTIDTVKIGYNDGKVSFSGMPTIHKTVPIETVKTLIESAYKHNIDVIRIDTVMTNSPVEINTELTKRGIIDVLAIGTSQFVGSPTNRRINIAVASKLYNGRIIKKGATFSFNSILEPNFSEENGFVEELVIKGGESIKELGGGICQVSTTMFRAALNAGLPIKERYPHTWAIPYYIPHGLDAAVYLGSKDLKWTNDTAGDVLIQTVLYGNTVHFILYGTPDNRQISFDGPYLWGYNEAPDDIVETDTLLVGTKEVVSTGKTGLSAKWIVNMVKDGKKIVYPIYSTYTAKPREVLVGSKESNNEPIKSDTEPLHTTVEEPIEPIIQAPESTAKSIIKAPPSRPLPTNRGAIKPIVKP